MRILVRYLNITCRFIFCSKATVWETRLRLLKQEAQRMLRHSVTVVLLAIHPMIVWAAEPEAVRSITLEELSRSLPKEPINVVFDVDDTVLFTSPGFQWGSRKYGADIVSAGVSIREEDLPGEEQRRKYREFWTRMNNELDEFSVKKWIAVELIALHKSRGDRIYFVTKRIFTGTERLTETLRREFGLPADSPAVIFTNRQEKTASFRSIKAHLSYGDSDGDIRESIRAGARPIRVVRSRASVNHDPTHNGAFGEEVLRNSEND